MGKLGQAQRALDVLAKSLFCAAHLLVLTRGWIVELRAGWLSVGTLAAALTQPVPCKACGSDLHQALLPTGP